MRRFFAWTKEGAAARRGAWWTTGFSILPHGECGFFNFCDRKHYKQLSSEAEEHNIILDNFVGFVPTLKINNILKKEFGDFRLSSNIDVNYGAAGIRL